MKLTKIDKEKGLTEAATSVRPNKFFQRMARMEDANKRRRNRIHVYSVLNLFCVKAGALLRDLWSLNPILSNTMNNPKRNSWREGNLIFFMSFRHWRSGKIVRRKNGKPFCIRAY